MYSAYLKRSFLLPLLALSLSPSRGSVRSFQLNLSPSSSSSSRRHDILHNSALRRTVTSTTNIMSTTITSESEENIDIIPGRPTWQQTMIRIKDPIPSLKFYCDILGMTLIDKFDFPQYKFALYFVTTLPIDQQPYKLIPGTQKAHDYLWNIEGVTLELTHNYGTEDDSTNFSGYHPGNAEKDGFGHIAVNVNDVYVTTDKLLQAGYSFKKKPDEGRMKGTSFYFIFCML